MNSNKHAFLILAHNNPEHVSRIIQNLESENHFFFIHVDKKSTDDFKEKLSKFKNCAFTDRRVNCHWGGFTLVEATMELLKTSFNYADFSYFHLISGADYFCSTNEKFDAFFKDNDKSYLEIKSATNFSWRVKIYTFNDYIDKRGKFGRFLPYINAIQKKIARYITLRKPLGLTFYYGSQWFSLHKHAIKFILDYCKQNPWFVRRFHFTYVPDESFFHIILMNSPLASSVIQNNLRFIDWKRKKEAETLPRILDIDDYDSIVNKGSFFCRKISYGKSDALMDKFDLLRGQKYDD